MKCREYIFELTSGRLDEAGWLLRARSEAHRWMCVRCRAFTHNDDDLLRAVRAQKDSHIQQLTADSPFARTTADESTENQ